MLLLDLAYLAGVLLVGPIYLCWRLLRGKRLASPWRRVGFFAPVEPGPGPVGRLVP